MSWWWLLVVAVLAVLGWYLSSTAARLDRLHRRVDAGRVAFDRSLLERALVAGEIAGGMYPEPGAALVIADAVHDARRAADLGDVERGLAESQLTQVLAAVFDEPESIEEAVQRGGAELMTDLESATRRVELSRRFLNDAVRACRAVRYQWVVRALGLAGHTPWPQTFEMHDTPPPGFGIR